MGMGTTELSPELTEKLARLERDNAALTACVNKAGLESVLAMENALDDATRLAATFEVQNCAVLICELVLSTLYSAGAFGPDGRQADKRGG